MSKSNLLLLLLMLFLCSCQPARRITSYIEDNQSDLLKFMMQESDFEGRTEWQLEIRRQGYETPTTLNHYLLEIASHGLTGEYEGKYVTIDNRLSRYEKTIDWIEPQKLIQDADEVVLNLPLPLYGKDSQSNCYVSQTLIRCEIIIWYDNVISQLWLQGSNLSQKDILQILVPVLSKIDKRLAMRIK